MRNRRKEQEYLRAYYDDWFYKTYGAYPTYADFMRWLQQRMYEAGATGGGAAPMMGQTAAPVTAAAPGLLQVAPADAIDGGGAAQVTAQGFVLLLPVIQNMPRKSMHCLHERGGRLFEPSEYVLSLWQLC